MPPITNLELAKKKHEINQEENRLYQEFNQILNQKYDFSKSFKHQSPSFLAELTQFYDAIQACHEKQVELTTQYFQLPPAEREGYWHSYSGDANQKKNYYEAFSALVDASKKLSNLQKMRVKSDALQLMTYETGTKMIVKVVDNVRNYTNNTNNIFTIVNEGYSVLLEKEANMQPSSEAEKNVRDSFSWRNQFSDFPELRRLFKDKNNIKNSPTGHISLSVDGDYNHLNIFTGMKSPEKNEILLYASPSYQSLYHELAHLNRAFRGSTKSSFKLPTLFKGLYSNEAEEIWNINLGKSSDNSLQKERGSPLRIFHPGFEITKDNDHLRVHGGLFSEDIDCIHSSLLNAEILFGRRSLRGLTAKNDQVIKLELHGIDDKIDISDSSVYLTIESSKLPGSNFKASDIKKFMVKFSTLARCNFDNAQLENSLFQQYTNLANSSFKQANLRGTVFKDCDLTECDFSNADLTNVVFSGTILGLESCCFDNAKIDHFLSAGLKKLVDQNALSINKAIEVEILLANVISKLKNSNLADGDAIINLFDKFKQNEVLLKMVANEYLNIDILVNYFKATGIYSGAISLLEVKMIQTLIIEGDFESFLNIIREEAHKKISLENLNLIFQTIDNSEVLKTLIKENKLSLKQIHQIIELDGSSAIEFLESIHKYKAIHSAISKSEIKIDAIIDEIRQKKESTSPLPLNDDDIISDDLFITCNKLLIEEVRQLRNVQKPTPQP